MMTIVSELSFACAFKLESGGPILQKLVPKNCPILIEGICCCLLLKTWRNLFGEKIFKQQNFNSNGPLRLSICHQNAVHKRKKARLF